MDDDMQAYGAADIELERRLEAYGRARLSPDSAATARTRARVMREARLQHEASRIAAYVGPALAQRRSPLRRAAMPFLAACVWLGIAVGTIAAAQPGGALYPTRIWIESAVLPASGADRVRADLDRLNDRISEALSAATHGDRSAVDAALAAYAGIADDATATAGDDAALADRVAQALSRHQAVLTALMTSLTDKGNETAAAAIDANVQRAIEHNAAVLANLAERQASGSSGHGQSGAGAGSTGTGSNNGQGNGATNGAGNGGTGGSHGGGAGSGSGTSNGGGNGGTSGGAGGGSNGGGSGSGNGGAGAQPSPTSVPSPARPDHTPRSGH